VGKDMSKLQKGDLSLIEIVEHVDDPKRYIITGKFKGTKGEVIFARVGEGVDDPRSATAIAYTAEIIAKELQETYALDAFLRRNKN